MVISKSLADLIADKLVVNKEKQVKEFEKEFRDYVYDTYISQTPKEVLELFKKQADWFYTQQGVMLDGYGFNWNYVSVRTPVIVNTPSGRAKLKFNKEVAAKCESLQNKWKKAEGELKQFTKDIYHVLLQLRTYKQIEKTFPEAAPFLPKQSLAIVPDISPIRKKLKQLQPA